MTERICADHGLLVDGSARLPDDPCEYHDERLLVLIGCNRLRCRKCDAWIRSSAPGVRLKENLRFDVKALYDAEDWTALPFVERSEQQVRVYACRCTSWVAERVDAIDNEHDSLHDPNVPWACVGHPLPQLPTTLGDVTISEQSSGEALVDKILRGSCPRELNRVDAVGAEPAAWLMWLYLYLDGLPIVDRLSAAIAARIDDPDPQTVGRVLHFFANFPRAHGVERLIARAEADITRVAVGYPIPEYFRAPTLWNVLIARLEQRTNTRDELDKRADALVRRVLLVPLAKLPHNDLGPMTLVELERQRRIHWGKEVDTPGGKMFMDSYARLKKRERADVVVTDLERFTTAFDDPDLRLFIADHIVEIDAAARGRWQHFMNLLSDYYAKPELGHLIVIAGMRVIKAGLVTPGEFREWINDRRAYGWVDDAWVLPLQSVLAGN